MGSAGRVQGSGFRAFVAQGLCSGLGFRVSGVRFRVEGC